jgi:hypothetical protein
MVPKSAALTEVDATRKYSMILLLFLGAIVVTAGALEMLREAEVLTFSLRIFAPLLLIVFGLWIAACAIECKAGCYPRT